MSVAPFFENEAFGPDDIKTMSVVLDEVCNSFHLTNDAEKEREDLAKRIIALARHGERNPAALRDGVLRGLAVSAARSEAFRRHRP